MKNQAGVWRLVLLLRLRSPAISDGPVPELSPILLRVPEGGHWGAPFGMPVSKVGGFSYSP